MVEEAEGLKLHLAPGTKTGYKGVYQQSSGRYSAKFWDVPAQKYRPLGSFDTAVEAAVAFARGVGPAGDAAAKEAKRAAERARAEEGKTTPPKEPKESRAQERHEAKLAPLGAEMEQAQSEAQAEARGSANAVAAEERRWAASVAEFKRYLKDNASQLAEGTLGVEEHLAHLERILRQHLVELLLRALGGIGLELGLGDQATRDALRRAQRLEEPRGERLHVERLLVARHDDGESARRARARAPPAVASGSSPRRASCSVGSLRQCRRRSTCRAARPLARPRRSRRPGCHQ